MKLRSLKFTLIILKITVSIVLIMYLYNTVNQNQSIFASLKQADVQWITFSILLLIPNVLLLSYKWWYLVRQVNPHVTYWASIGSTLGGLSLGFLTPGRIGEIAKGFFFRNIDKLQITGLALIDRVFNMLAISLFGLISIFLIFQWEYEISIFIFMPTFILAALMLTVVIYFLTHPRFFRNMYQNYSQLNKLKKTADHFFSSIKKLTKKSMTYMMLISLLYQFLVSIQFYFSIKAFDSRLTFFDNLIAAFATAFTKAVLPIGIADIGVRETAANIFFGFFLDNFAAIFNGSLFLFLLNVAFPAICGIIMLPKLNFQKDL